MSKGTNPIKEEQWNQKVTKAADSFWSAFQMTENGKVKSTLLLYSFCLCWVYIAVYVVAFACLLDPLEAMCSGAPTAVVYLVEILVPTLVGTAACFLPWPLFKEKRLIPASYVWMFLLAVACLITMLVLMQNEPETRRLFLLFFLQAVPAPVLLGCALSACLYYRHWKRHPAAAVPAQKIS